MNVKELIDLLKQQPPEKKVLIRGYEDGYNDISKIRTIRVEHKQNTEWYYGEYLDSKVPDAIEAIELFGENTTDEKLV